MKKISNFQFLISNERYRLTRAFAYFLTAFGIVLIAPAVAAAASLSLSPASGSYSADSTFEVKIQLDTAGVTTSGTDAYIRFDPTALQVVDANPGTNGVQILAGTLYSQTSFNSVDNSGGKISFSGSKSGGSSGYSGSGTLATITFQALKETSSTAANFDFTVGATTDSNVISQADSSDVLTKVTNGKYTLTAASGSDDTADGTDGTGTDGTGTGDGTGNGTDDGSGSGAGGKSGSEGSGGSSTVAATGIDLRWYALFTLIALLGAGYFLSKRHPKGR